MNDSLKIGIIGTGWWACEAHIPAILEHPGATLYAIQTRKKERAEKLCVQHKIPHWFASWEKLLDLPQLDAVIICSTPHVHYAQAKAALEKGLHVLIEKPMSITAGESRELIDLATSKNLQFLISCPWHYTEHALEARRIIQEGRLGKLRFINIFMTNFTLGLYEGKRFSEALAGSDGVDAVTSPEVEPNLESYSDPATAGGGQIYCQASHIFAYIGFITDLEPREVTAMFSNSGTLVDNANTLSITFKDGVLGSIGTLATHADVERMFEIRLVGSKGILSLELWKGTCRLRLADGKVCEFPPLDEDLIYPKFAPANNLVNAILGLAPNGSPAYLGHYAMRLIEAACESNNKKVLVSL